MFSKKASILGPITTIGPIYLVYYLATSEVPVATQTATVAIVEKPKEEQEEKIKEEVEEKKVEEQKKEPKKEEKANETITKTILQATENFLNVVKTITSY